MELTERSRRSFNWDETPFDVFGSNRDRHRQAHLFQPRRALRNFPREWRGPHRERKPKPINPNPEGRNP